MVATLIWGSAKSSNIRSLKNNLILICSTYFIKIVHKKNLVSCTFYMTCLLIYYFGVIKKKSKKAFAKDITT